MREDGKPPTHFVSLQSSFLILGFIQLDHNL
jgi:hypothetical protein